MEKITSEGKCIYCGKMYKGTGILRHVKTHLNKLETDYKGKKGKSYLLKVKADVMFLILLVDENQSILEIDDFLRKIWLECCGHLSSFHDPKKDIYYPELKDDFFFGDKEVEEEDENEYIVKDIFHKGLKLEYDYDFGSTTRLFIDIAEEYSIPEKKGIKLISRNEPLKIMCAKCQKKPAIEMCTVHWGDNNFFCEDCGEIHKEECEDFEDYAMPVVNSPRMGVCAYTGGTIDTERDGVYKL